MRQIFHDARLQKNFLKAGYVTVPLLSEAQVRYILAQLNDLHPDDNFTPDGRGVAKCSYHCSFLDTNSAYKQQTYNLLKDVFTPFVERYLVGYHILNCNFYVKPPQTGEFQIHQNWPAISDINDTTVTIWCPLVDVEASNGALQVVEGSHKILPHVETPGSPAYFSNFQQALVRDYLKSMPMNAGEGIIFDDSLIHWSQKNDSDYPRIAIQILCIPNDATPTFFFKLNEENFEMIYADSEFFLHNSMMNLLTRQPEWQSLGLIENQNRLITEVEFAELIHYGDRIRS